MDNNKKIDTTPEVRNTNADTPHAKLKQYLMYSIT